MEILLKCKNIILGGLIGAGAGLVMVSLQYVVPEHHVKYLALVAILIWISFFGLWVFSLLRYRDVFTPEQLRVGWFYFWITLAGMLLPMVPFLLYEFLPAPTDVSGMFIFDLSVVAMTFLPMAIGITTWIIGFYMIYHRGYGLVFYPFHQNEQHIKTSLEPMDETGKMEEKILIWILWLSGAVMVIGPFVLLIWMLVTIP